MGNDHIELTAYEAHTDSTVELPLASSGVHAGFPSPAEDFVEGSLDLNRLLIKDSAATFFVRVEGDSMQDAGIYDGNLLVVDKSLHPQDGDIVVCFLDGEFTLKRIRIQEGKITLLLANKRYKPIEVNPDDEFTVWGVVRSSINMFR